MKISVIGTGYVGLITGACFAELGNDVTCVDIVKEKVDLINSGESPIHEMGLDELLEKHIGKNLKATTDLESAVLGSDITFICVGTPDAPDGGIDLKYIKSASEGIGKALAKKGGYHVVVDKSTVVPGTTDSVILPIIEGASGKKAREGFGVAMNPEFLREGLAIEEYHKQLRALGLNVLPTGRFDGLKLHVLLVVLAYLLLHSVERILQCIGKSVITIMRAVCVAGLVPGPS